MLSSLLGGGALSALLYNLEYALYSLIPLGVGTAIGAGIKIFNKNKNGDKK